MADTRKSDRLSMYRRPATPKKRKARRKQQPTPAAPTRRRAIGALPAWHVGDPDVMMI